MSEQFRTPIARQQPYPSAAGSASPPFTSGLFDVTIASDAQTLPQQASRRTGLFDDIVAADDARQGRQPVKAGPPSTGLFDDIFAADDAQRAQHPGSRQRTDPGAGIITDPSLNATPFQASAPPDPGAGYDPNQNYTNDTARTMLQGVTSFGDEIIAGVKSILPTQENIAAHGRAAAGGPSAYQQHLAYERGRLDDFKDYDPTGYTGLQIGGGLMSAPVVPGVLFNRLTRGLDGLSRINQIRRLATAGAVTGAVSGAHHGAGDAHPRADASMSEAIMERGQGAVMPATIGAATGAVLAPLAGEIGRGVNLVRTAVSDNLTPERAAASMMLRRLDDSGTTLDDLTQSLAVGPQSFSNPARRSQVLQMYGEELERTGAGDVNAIRAARDAAIQRAATEFGVSPSTAAGYFPSAGRSREVS